MTLPCTHLGWVGWVLAEKFFLPTHCVALDRIDLFSLGFPLPLLPRPCCLFGSYMLWLSHGRLPVAEVLCRQGLELCERLLTSTVARCAMPSASGCPSHPSICVSLSQSHSASEFNPRLCTRCVAPSSAALLQAAPILASYPLPYPSAQSLARNLACPALPRYRVGGEEQPGADVTITDVVYAYNNLASVLQVCEGAHVRGPHTYVTVFGCRKQDLSASRNTWGPELILMRWMGEWRQKAGREGCKRSKAVLLWVQGWGGRRQGALSSRCRVTIVLQGARGRPDTTAQIMHVHAHNCRPRASLRKHCLTLKKRWPRAKRYVQLAPSVAMHVTRMGYENSTQERARKRQSAQSSPQLCEFDLHQNRSCMACTQANGFRPLMVWCIYVPQRAA